MIKVNRSVTAVIREMQHFIYIATVSAQIKGGALCQFLLKN